MGPKAPAHGDLQYFVTWISEQLGRLEGKIESIKAEFVMRREFENQQQDIDRAHAKIREVEDNLQKLEVAVAGDRGETRGRFTMTEKILGIVLTFVVAAAMAYLGLK